RPWRRRPPPAGRALPAGRRGPHLAARGAGGGGHGRRREGERQAMMRRALLVLGALGTMGLLCTMGLGYMLTGAADERARVQVLVSLASTLVVMFSHSWIVLYLLAVGQVVRKTVAESGRHAEAAERCRALRRQATPWLLGALVTITAAFLLGAAAFTGRVGVW